MKERFLTMVALMFWCRLSLWEAFKRSGPIALLILMGCASPTVIEFDLQKRGENYVVVHTSKDCQMEHVYSEDAVLISEGGCHDNL